MTLLTTSLLLFTALGLGAHMAAVVRKARRPQPIKVRAAQKPRR